MALDVEAIYAALFARLQSSVTGVQTFTRRVLGYEHFTPEKQPALVMIQGDEDTEHRPDLPDILHLEVKIALYVRVPEDATVSPDATMNGLRRLVKDALKRPASEAGSGDDWATTLGGLCEACYVSGQTLYSQEVESGQAVMIIPIEILATEQ